MDKRRGRPRLVLISFERQWLRVPNIIFENKMGEACLAAWRSAGVEVRSVVVRQDGEVVFEHAAAPFSLEHVHPLYSVTKSFTSVAVGMLVNEGRLSLADRWISYFPEYEGEIADERFRNVTVRNLLTMTMGQESDLSYIGAGDDWAHEVLHREFDWKPGEVFHYDSLCSHLLSMLVQRISGTKESDYLAERLFTPLGIRNWWWEEDQAGHTTGGFGLHLSTPDLAKFGQCLLDGGKWRGERIIPAEWVAEATKIQMETSPFYPSEATEDSNGYGYQFWMCRRGGFRCSGLFGQLCYIRPTDGLVIACSSSTTGSKALLDPLYEVLFKESSVRETVASERDFDSIPVPVGLASGGRLSSLRLEGIYHCIFGDFEEIDIRFHENELDLSLLRDGREYGVRAGYKSWVCKSGDGLGVGDLFPFVTHEAERDDAPAWDVRKLFAAYAWTSPTSLQIETRELDYTRRCFIDVQIGGIYAVCRVRVEGMCCFPAPSELTAILKLG